MTKNDKAMMIIAYMAMIVYIFNNIYGEERLHDDICGHPGHCYLMKVWKPCCCIGVTPVGTHEDIGT
jgi:hypothetical protein